MKFTKSHQYKPQRSLNLDWDTFRKGINILLKESEIDKEELAQADNLMLIGKGVPTKRWGTQLYFQAGNMTGSVRGLKGFYKSDGTNELLAITDDGFLTKRSGASYSRINGVSWASGNDAQMAQLDDTMYIVNGQRALVKYSSPTLLGFSVIEKPLIRLATNLSGASGTTSKSYRLSVYANTGETLASDSFTLNNQPAKLGGVAGGTIRLTFTDVSGASLAIGYNLYGRSAGVERFIASFPIQTTTYDDDGSITPSELSFPPFSNTTGGIIAKYVVRYQDRLIFGGISGSPTKIAVSGKAPYNERFDLANGGNYLDIEPDNGDNITGLATFRDRIIVFKEKSIWQVTLPITQAGNFFFPEPDLQLITNSYGCIAPKSIISVENDIFFMSRDGVNSLGYQSGFAIDVLRSNSISTKIRTFFENLSTAQKEGAVATYFDKKYILAIPGYDKSVVFDIERGAWMGPWSKDANLFEVYTDSNNDQHLLYGNDDSALVDEYSDEFTTDKGTAIATALRTRQEDFGDWSLFKFIKDVFLQFRNISGSASISVRLEDRNGNTVSAADFTLSSSFGTSGFGSDLWGQAVWGTTTAEIGEIDVIQVIRWIKLNKTARTVQVSIVTTGAQDKYELLGVRARGTATGRINIPSSWRG